MDEWVFSYYLFLSKFNRDPIDMEEFVDGLTALKTILLMEAKVAGSV